jgi:hypothetical protein
LHLLVDSTGLKIYGEGKWLDQKHGPMAADGAYGGEAVYDAAAERHPRATIIIPKQATSSQTKL